MSKPGREAGLPNPATHTDDRKKVLVGARVPATFHRRIQSECVRREMSVQELVITALRFYFKTPVEFDQAEIRFYKDDPNYTQKQADERNAWTDLWDKYTTKMPREKTQIMTRAMEWDLTMQRSSRRKSDQPQGRAARKGVKHEVKAE